jgi:hypothetical protein
VSSDEATTSRSASTSELSLIPSASTAARAASASGVS